MARAGGSNRSGAANERAAGNGWATGDENATVEQMLDGLGARLRRLRKERSLTLDAVAASTGISASTLSRLEAGRRRATLELLLPLARAYQTSVEGLLGEPKAGDPRVRPRPRRVDGSTVIPLTRHAGPQEAFKMVIPRTRSRPQPCTHDGAEWLYVLSGRLRLVLAQHDLVLEAGEAAEFDTHVPHWFGSTGEGPVEILSLFGRQGRRVHLRARPQQH